ncbi:OsmC family protein [Rivibacter subsaxonicus]|uniref:Putative OsmC-like protein n=1 Tax=Rivibacter subsaxonicus TaxID=457575 RepID=A0A4Q7VN49_9BURK|nr:OsmC family protein [Rivibacter subsaxonicus]RZT97770.1 putative OsmC-like protein [Rivibacter subsaxonicus]
MSQTLSMDATHGVRPSHVVNGVNVDTLMATVNAIQADAGLGACRFRASNTWLSGNHNRSTVAGFYGARQEIAHRQTFKMDADEPAILAGDDNGANPVEHLLHALASCLTTSMVAHAAVRGIRIEALESRLEDEIDLRGFLGLADDVPKGYTAIRAAFRVKAHPKDLPRIRELTAFSPVFNTLAQGTRVDVEVEPMGD